jgi:hypothetical protein
VTAQNDVEVLDEGIESSIWFFKTNSNIKPAPCNKANCGSGWLALLRGINKKGLLSKGAEKPSGYR